MRNRAIWCFVWFLFAAAPIPAATDDAAKVFRTLSSVYETAEVLEEMKASQRGLPKVATPLALSQARFGSDALVDLLKDAWGTPLHIESDPARGYVIVAAGLDRKFDRASWSKKAATKSAADDIVLRDGELVRSPVAWATGVVDSVAGGAARLIERSLELSRHRATVANMRAIASDALAGFPPAPRLDGWERPIHVETDAAKNTSRIVSAGPDGKRGTTDDLVMRDYDFARNEEPPAQPIDALAEEYAGFLVVGQRFRAAR